MVGAEVDQYNDNSDKVIAFKDGKDTNSMTPRVTILSFKVGAESINGLTPSNNTLTNNMKMEEITPRIPLKTS